METIILGWYVLVESDSVIMLTLFGSLLFVGTLLSPTFGASGDRFGRRLMLCLMRASYIIVAAVIMVLGLVDELTPFRVLAVIFVGGLVRPSDISMRNSLIGDTIPSEHLMGAAGLTRMTQDSARIAGALAGAGLFSVLGVGWAYAIVTAFYVVGFLFTLGVSGSRPAGDGVSDPKPAASMLEQVGSHFRDLKDGFVYIRDTPTVLAVMWLAFLVNMTAFPISHGLLPYVAKEVYLADENALGQMVASFSVGALIGAFGLAVAGRYKYTARLMVIMVVLWYVALLVFSLVPSKLGGLPVLLLTGVAHSVGMTSMAAFLLTVTTVQFRGRVLGIRFLAVYGLPIGLMVAGVLINWIGYVGMVWIYCWVGIAITAFIAHRWRDAIWRGS